MFITETNGVSRSRVSGETTMKAAEFVKTLEEGKNVYRNREGWSPIHLSMVKHPKGTFIYMDVENLVFVTVDKVEQVAEHEILGWAGDEPVLTIKTEEWFA